MIRQKLLFLLFEPIFFKALSSIFVEATEIERKPDITDFDVDYEDPFILTEDSRLVPLAHVENFYDRSHKPGHPHKHHKPDHDRDDYEKSLMHLVFPVIIVFGLGSLIVPMVAVFFAAFMYNNGSLGGGGGGDGCFKNRISGRKGPLKNSNLQFKLKRFITDQGRETRNTKPSPIYQ